VLVLAASERGIVTSYSTEAFKPFIVTTSGQDTIKKCLESTKDYSDESSEE